MFKMKRLVLAACILAMLSANALAGATREDVANRLEDFRKFFVDFQYAPDNAIPGDLLADCYGVIIMRQYKAGFVVGLKGGDGAIFMHDRYSNAWSAPGFLASAEGSFGFQIGGQAVDAIILIMNQSGVDMLLKTRFKIGVDASAAAGPVGRDVSAKVGAGTALLTYSRSKGLFAGASFEGGVLVNNNSYNRAMYGRDIGLKEILLDRQVGIPREAVPMINTLKSYAVRATAPSSPATSPGVQERPLQPIPSYDSQTPSYQVYSNQGMTQTSDPYFQGGTYQQGYNDPGTAQPYDSYYQGQQQNYQQPGYQQQQGYQTYSQPAPYAAPQVPQSPPVIPPAPAASDQAQLDAAASQAAAAAQAAAQAAWNAQMAAEEAARRAAAARGN